MATWEMRLARRSSKVPPGHRYALYRHPTHSLHKGTGGLRGPPLPVPGRLRQGHTRPASRADCALRLPRRAGPLGRFEPHVVVSSRPDGTHPAGCGAWAQIPTDEAKKRYRAGLPGRGPVEDRRSAALRAPRGARGDGGAASRRELVGGLLSYTAGNVGKGALHKYSLLHKFWLACTNIVRLEDAVMWRDLFL